MGALHDDISLEIAKDALSGELIIPPGFDPELLSDEVCVARLEAEGVLVNLSVLSRITATVAEHKQSPNAAHHVRLGGQPPVHGRDGRLALTCQAEDEQNEDARVDFYARSPFILVQSGQRIGRIVPPENGEDGADIRGNTIPAKQGKALSIRLDDSIQLDHEGNLIAQASGTLERTRAGLKINKMLAIDGFVDFQTGHVHFDGDVTIGKGVRDRFTVQTKGSVVIGGLVEGATCITGLDATFAGGMAAKDKGVIQIGRDCRARYLNQVEGYVGGELLVDREIINCRLQVGGAINAPNSSVIGGENHVLGAMTIKELGSQLGVRTVIHLGSSPRFEEKITEAEAKIAKINARLTEYQDQVKLLESGSRTLTAQMKERLTELLYEKAEVQAELDKLAPRHEALVKHYQTMRNVCLSVQSAVYPGTVVAVGQSAAQFIDMVRGPILIEADHGNQIVYRHANQSLRQPIRLIARPTRLSPTAPASPTAA